MAMLDETDAPRRRWAPSETETVVVRFVAMLLLVLIGKRAVPVWPALGGCLLLAAVELRCIRLAELPRAILGQALTVGYYAVFPVTGLWSLWQQMRRDGYGRRPLAMAGRFAAGLVFGTFLWMITILPAIFVVIDAVFGTNLARFI